MDFIVINDGSSDRTAAICREQGYPLLDLPCNLGLADAVVMGMKYAWSAGRPAYDAVIQYDADGQHRPEYLSLLLQTLEEGYDIVCGSRFLQDKRPLSPRGWGSALISLAIRVTTGVVLTDPTSGQRAYGRRIIEEFATRENMTPEPDTVSYLIKLGANVCEVPVLMDERRAGTSYLGAFSSVKYMLRMGISILLVQFFRGGSLS
jgi:glycosyltransferase involved in cell wall biosynthesis